MLKSAITVIGALCTFILSGWKLVEVSKEFDKIRKTPVEE